MNNLINQLVYYLLTFAIHSFLVKVVFVNYKSKVYVICPMHCNLTAYTPMYITKTVSVSTKKYW